MSNDPNTNIDTITLHSIFKQIEVLQIQHSNINLKIIRDKSLEENIVIPLLQVLEKEPQTPIVSKLLVKIEEKFNTLEIISIATAAEDKAEILKVPESIVKKELMKLQYQLRRDLIQAGKYISLKYFSPDEEELLKNEALDEAFDD